MIKRIAGWRGKLLTQAGRLILIKTCLSSILVYLLSFFKFPRWAIDFINSHMANCFWDDYESHRKLHLAHWHLICMKKKYGGLGVPNLKDLNLCLLGSWVKRFISDENKLWKKIIEEKYCKGSSIFYSDRKQASPFWKGVILAAQALKFGYRWVVGNGQKVRFCEDIWIGTAPLAVQFWELYCICNEKTEVVADTWVDGELKLTFRRTFDDRMMQTWYELGAVLDEVVLNDADDALIWGYNSSGIYSSQSLYTIINYRGVTPVYTPAVWNINVPPKIQLLLWLLSHNKLATIDNLNKKGMHKHEMCVFCDEKESINHLFFKCCVSGAVWDYVNEFLGMSIGSDYMSVAAKWLDKKKYDAVNIISTVVLTGIWLTRNDFVFNNQDWSDVKLVLRRIWKLKLEWQILCKDRTMEMMQKWLIFLEQQIREPLKVTRG
jgi:hypothetical protein